MSLPLSIIDAVADLVVLPGGPAYENGANIVKLAM